LREEFDKDVSLAKVKKLKKELADSGYSFQAALNANASLGIHLKYSNDAHSWCEVEKKALGKKVSQMLVEEGLYHAPQVGKNSTSNLELQ